MGGYADGVDGDGQVAFRRRTQCRCDLLGKVEVAVGKDPAAADHDRVGIGKQRTPARHQPAANEAIEHPPRHHLPQRSRQCRQDRQRRDPHATRARAGLRRVASGKIFGDDGCRRVGCPKLGGEAFRYQMVAEIGAMPDVENDYLHRCLSCASVS